MDYLKALRDLSAEKNKLDQAIKTLEMLVAANDPSPRRRNRKVMAMEERGRIYEKMRTYFESRHSGT